MLRRLHPHQPDAFAFSPANRVWAEAQMTKYPEGRQASAIIPLLWRAQEQEGWLSRPAIEHVADMLGMAYIRSLEVATFYFMFHLQPVGSVAHIQVCGTTSCMICGAEDLVAVCRELIAAKPHAVSADGKFSWEEVECLGACANAPMAQIGKDYYEDLTAEKLRDLIARFSTGEVPLPGSQNGRYAAEPLSGVTSLAEYVTGRPRYNASVQLAADLGDTIKRIDGTEAPILTPWRRTVAAPAEAATPARGATVEPKPSAGRVADKTGATVQEAPELSIGKPRTVVTARPMGLPAPRDGKPDALGEIVGIGPKIEALCHQLGYYHFDQIAAWTPAEIAWVDENLPGFKGRVTRDNWITQARDLMARRGRS